MKDEMSSSVEFASKPGINTILHGDHNANDGQKVLHAGRLSMIYENGNIRRISAGNTEIIRMVYAAVRNSRWITILPEISDEDIKSDSNSFLIRYTCTYRSADINFSARIFIEGKTDSSLVFGFDGEALTTFYKNRIGFCVLHPVEGYSGKQCIIEHPGGNSEILQFPEDITPHQPFHDIKKMKWKMDGSVFFIEYFGEIFETEDQRNWTDASYKTYCTPLRLPYPVKISKGEMLKQRIEFKAELNSYRKEPDNDIKLYLSDEINSDIPKIGIGKSTRPKPLTKEEITCLRDLKFDHYRIDLYLFSSDWKSKADLAADEAQRLAYPIEFALFFNDDSITQASEFTEWLSKKHQDVTVITIFHEKISHTPDLLTDRISPILKSAFPGIKIGCGSNANFAQLNRNRPESAHADLISHSIQPQEHASDNTTLIENLQAQQYTVETTKKFANGKGVWISPVNIQRRFNANIENFESLSETGEFPIQTDSRIMSLFGAGWTTGSLKYLLESGVQGLTYYETVGERGIIQGDYPSRWPLSFQSVEGMIFPVYHVFKFILSNKSYKVTKTRSTHPLSVEILALSNGNQMKIILVNFSNGEQKIRIDGFTKQILLRQLNAESFKEATSDSEWLFNAPCTSVSPEEKIILSPFSVSFIE